jgi:hypothetical protein
LAGTEREELVDSTTMRTQPRPIARDPQPPVRALKASTRRLKERREVRAREQMVAAWLRSLSTR